MTDAHSGPVDPGEPLTSSPWISARQAQLAADFFALPQSAGFVISGGVALIATGVVGRLSDDLDLFTHPGAGNVTEAAAALETLMTSRGWAVDRIHDHSTFVRMSITTDDGEELLVDLALDSVPLAPPGESFLGPTMGLEENAGRKVLALFGRAEPRDFVDVFALKDRFSRARLLELAADRDAGFDLGVLAQMIGSLGRVHDEDLPMPPGDVAGLRQFFADWRTELEST